MQLANNKIIAVVGGNQPSPEESVIAENIGRQLAEKGAVLVCGGLGGVMEAACRGAAAAGGLTIGILPGDSRKAANPYVHLPIVTGMTYARNIIIVRTAQAVIAVGGKYGTLSEIAHALQAGVPVIGIGTWSLAINGRPDTSIIPAESVDEAVNLALEMAAD